MRFVGGRRSGVWTPSAHDFVREVANCEQMGCLQAFDQREKVLLLAAKSY